MKQLNKKATKILGVLGLLLLAVVGMTIAYYNSMKNFENEFYLKAPGVAVYEKFNPTDWWVPGEEKSKEVIFKNTGKQDMLLRFSYSIEWIAQTDAEGNPLVPPRKAEEVIKLNWNIEENNQKGEDDVAPENNIPKDFKKVTQTTPDGRTVTYYYYNKILKAGEPTDVVLESVKFVTDMSNDEHEFDYSSQQINLTIKGETVLADSAAAEDQWKDTPEIKAEIDQQTGTVTWSLGVSD